MYYNLFSLLHNVYLLGQKSNPYSYLSRSDQFILASAWEGFGMVVVEALAVGTPVIVTDIDGGPRQIIENGKFGELVPVNSPISIAEAVINNHEKDVDVSSLIKKASEFDKETIVQKYYRAIFK